MRKLLVFLVVLCLAATVSVAGAAEFSADMKMKAGPQAMDGKFFLKGKKQRTEMKPGGQDMISILDMETGKTYLLVPAMQAYLEAEPQGLNAKDWTAGPPDNAKKVGTEKVQGYDTVVYEIVEADGSKAKVWYAEKLTQPIKFQGSDPQGNQVVMEMFNIKEGKVSDKLFTVPAGYKKMDPAMLGQTRGNR